MPMLDYTNKSGSLWLDEFKMIELGEIMRQRGDSQFAQLLCRVPTATCTDEDIKILESRTITDDHPNFPDDALHAMPTLTIVMWMSKTS